MHAEREGGQAKTRATIITTPTPIGKKEGIINTTATAIVSLPDEKRVSHRTRLPTTNLQVMLLDMITNLFNIGPLAGR